MVNTMQIRWMLLSLALAPASLPAQAGGGGTPVRQSETIYLHRFGGPPSPEMQLLRARMDSLRSALEVERMNSPEHARIRQEMTRVLHAMAGAMSREDVPGRVAFSGHTDWVPKGWIGINVEGPHLREVTPAGLMIRYFAHPEISSVEARSPAEQAGILAGDVLLAYNGTDVSRERVNVTRLLEPDKRIVVTVRRGPDVREVPIAVGRAPRQLMVRRELTDAPARTDAPRIAHITVRERDTLQAMRVFGFFDERAGPLFGASLVAVNEELGRTLGVPGGLLVTDVAPETHARTAGLRGGDVILRAGGTDVRSLVDLRRMAVEHADVKVLDLDIVREGKRSRVQLKW